jgi:hypothetical protein
MLSSIVLKNLHNNSPLLALLIVMVSEPVPVFPPNPPNRTAETIAPPSDLVCSVSKVPPITASTPKILATSSFVTSSNL